MLCDVLRQRFGHDAFLPPQREVIEHLLGGGDALVLLPTGGGKSLCYQLPALVKDGLTVVLSPLIALMQDQVDALRAKGIAATFINSSLSRAEREARLAQVRAGGFKLLYVTPERFRNEAFVEAIGAVKVALLAVDEAHCVSAWGHDFRPEYGKVGDIRRLLGDPPTIALTATATPDTQADVRRALRIPDARLFFTGIERPNLFVAVRPLAHVDGEDAKVARIVEVVRALGGPGIVYASLIKDLERLRERLWKEGIDAPVYHGDLGAGERRRVQRTFLESRSGVLLATNAFGMGVDKPDIRFILHAQVPGSLESLVQEIGRAGRDGKPSLCELSYDPADLDIQRQFVEWQNPEPAFVRGVYDQLVRWGDTLHARELQDLRETLLLKNRHDGRPEVTLGLLRAERIVDGSFENHDLRVLRPLERGEEDRLVPGGKRARDLDRLRQLMEYARGGTCRKRTIHEYFGIPPAHGGGPCGSCDVCADTEVWLRANGSAAPASEAARREDADAPVQVGDWLRIDGRFAVRVRRIERTRDGFAIHAESAGDFRVRRYDLARVTWERM